MRNYWCIGRPPLRSYLAAGMEATQRGRACTAMMGTNCNFMLSDEPKNKYLENQRLSFYQWMCPRLSLWEPELQPSMVHILQDIHPSQTNYTLVFWDRDWYRHGVIILLPTTLSIYSYWVCSELCWYNIGWRGSNFNEWSLNTWSDTFKCIFLNEKTLNKKSNWSVCRKCNLQ